MESPPPLTCDGGEKLEYGDYEFCYNDEKKNYQEALDYCAANNLTLVEPSSKALSDIVNQVCKETGDVDCSWIDLQCSGDSCDAAYDDWTWTNGQTTLNMINFFHSDDGEVISNNGAVQVGDLCAGIWKHDDCTTTWSSS